MKADDFRKRMQDGKVPPVCLLYGEETLLIGETIDLIREKLSAGDAASLDQEIFYGSESDASAIVQSARTLSLFGDSKLILVREVERMPDPQKERLLACIEDPCPRVTLVLTAVKPDMRKRFFAQLQKLCPCVRFYHPYDTRETGTWIRSYLRRKGFGIQSGALGFLCEAHGRELLVLKSELDKLILYKGKPGEITLSEAAAVSGQSQEWNAFELADAVGERNAERALAVYSRLMDEGVPPLLILGALAAKFRKLWMGKALEQKGCTEKEILRTLKMNYRGDRFLRQLQGFREGEMENIHPLLLAVDGAIKEGRGCPEALMEVMIHRICRGHLRSRGEAVHLAREP